MVLAQLQTYSVKGLKLPFDHSKTMAYRNLTVTAVKPGAKQQKARKEKDLETQAVFQTRTPLSTLGERKRNDKKRLNSLNPYGSLIPSAIAICSPKRKAQRLKLPRAAGVSAERGAGTVLAAECKILSCCPQSQFSEPKFA